LFNLKSNRMQTELPTYEIRKIEKYKSRLKEYTRELAVNKLRYEKLIDYTNKKATKRRILTLEKEIARHEYYLKLKQVDLQ